MAHPHVKNGEKPETKLLQKHVLQLRLEQKSFDQIADELGYSDTYIKKLYRKAMKEVIVEDVAQVRKFELMKLDRAEREVLRILNSFHPLVSHGSVVYDSVEEADGTPVFDPVSGEKKMVRLQDSGPYLAAVDRYLKIQDSRARLLGLNAPIKTALTDPTGTREAGFSLASLKGLSDEDLNALEAVLSKLAPQAEDELEEEEESDSGAAN